MPDSPLLPELARSLRSFGAHRDGPAERAHSAVFLPLLEARMRAGDESRELVLEAFRGSVLLARIETLALAAAVTGVAQPARGRALSAQTMELLQPLRAALLSLDAVAVAAREDAIGWNLWVVQLRRVFSIADTACQEIARLLASRDHANEKAPWTWRAWP